MQETWVRSWVGKAPWSRRWHHTPVLLPGKFHGHSSLAGYSLWGCKESDMTAWLSTHTQIMDVRAKTVRLLEQSVWVIQCFLKYIPKATKEVNKWDYVKIETSMLQTKLSRKWKDSLWNEILANHLSDKELVSGMFKEFLEHSKKTSNPI